MVNFTYNLIELFILLVGIVWKVLIQVVLCDGIHNIFLITAWSLGSHISNNYENLNYS
jgi:hypothetical protein